MSGSAHETRWALFLMPQLHFIWNSTQLCHRFFQLLYLVMIHIPCECTDRYQACVCQEYYASLFSILNHVLHTCIYFLLYYVYNSYIWNEYICYCIWNEYSLYCLLFIITNKHFIMQFKYGTIHLHYLIASFKVPNPLFCITKYRDGGT